MLPLVSVIIPCFNDGKYILDAINSVDLNRNTAIEIVIVDDGSDDENTTRILNELSEPRIRIFHSRHVGPSGARNIGIENARGLYILPLDADDRIEPEYIDEARKVLEHDREIGVVYCHADLFGKESGPWRLPDYSIENMLFDNVVFVTAMFRKEDWSAVGGFKTDMRCGLEDYDFFLGILELGKRIYQLPQTYFHYRIRQNSRTTSFVNDIEDVKQAYEMIYVRHADLYERYMDVYLKKLRHESIEHRYKTQKVLQSFWLLRKVIRFPLIQWLKRKIQGGAS